LIAKGIKLLKKEEMKKDKQEEERLGEIDVLEILERLKDELKEFSRLLPTLDEKRELLEKHVNKEREKIAEIESLIPKLQEKKRSLEEGIKLKQEEISKIDEIKLILQKIF